MPTSCSFQCETCPLFSFSSYLDSIQKPNVASVGIAERGFHVRRPVGKEFFDRMNIRDLSSDKGVHTSSIEDVHSLAHSCKLRNGGTTVQATSSKKGLGVRLDSGPRYLAANRAVKMRRRRRRGMEFSHENSQRLAEISTISSFTQQKNSCNMTGNLVLQHSVCTAKNQEKISP